MANETIREYPKLRTAQPARHSQSIQEDVEPIQGNVPAGVETRTALFPRTETEG